VNLKEIRDQMFAHVDWAPSQSTEAVARVDGFINSAYNRICLESPFLFFESTVKFATQTDVVPTLIADTISLVLDDTVAVEPNQSNPWVFQQNQAVTSPAQTGVQWFIDRSWDGRTIEITDADGIAHRNTIRTVWKILTNPQDVTSIAYRLSVVQPWNFKTLGSGPFKYRIYTEKYNLPDDLVEVRSLRLWQNSRNWPLSVLGQQEAEDLSIADPKLNIARGLPRTVFRRNHVQIPGPGVSPKVELDPSAQAYQRWQGPEPRGTFEYVITYTWGKRDIFFGNQNMGYAFGYEQEWSNDETSLSSFNPDPLKPEDASSNRFREPLWESAPSPVSVPVTPEIIDNGVAKAVKITLPNIEYMLGFFSGGQAFGGGVWKRKNMHQSGVHVRIYRRRSTEDFTAYDDLSTVSPAGVDVTNLNKLDIKNAFYLLSEFRIDENNGGIFYDNGRIIPDYSRRLRDVHGYQTVQLYPQPNERYELDVRCIRRPPKLEHSQDVPLVHAEAVDLIVQRALVYLYESMGNPEGSQIAQLRYDRQLFTLAKRYGDLREASRPILRRFSRASRVGNTRGNLLQWWTTKV
tara:strand:- start:896 stop:2620 length:1725 start_codon:yes stop_codon:yes gene_type:complete